MVLLAVITGAILTIIFVIKKRQLEATGGKRLAYHFLDKSLEFLIPFTIIGTFFLLLSYFVAGTSNKTTLQHLILFEKLIGIFKWFVSFFEVSALVAIGLLFIFYFLSLTRIPSKYTSHLIPYFKKYQKIVKMVSLIIIILFSFTFFGTQTGEPAARLRFRIHEAEGKYGELRQEVEGSLKQEVARQLLEKVKSSLPKEYRDDLEEQSQFYVIFSNLQSEYQYYRTNYARRDPRTEIIINAPPPPDPPPNPRGGGDKPGGGGGGTNPTASDPSLDKVPDKSSNKSPDTSSKRVSGESASETPQPGKRIVYDLFEESERVANPTDTLPPQASAEKIAEASQSVKTFRERFQPEAVKLLQSEHGQELAAQLPESFTGKIKEAVFKSLTDRYPILEPIIDVFFGTLDKELETRTQKAVDKVTKALAQNPANASSVIAQEASQVVKETQVKTPTPLLNKARQMREAWRKRIQGIRDTISRLRTQGQKFDEIAETIRTADEQIDLLTCKNEEARKAAAAKLAAASPHLTETQVIKIEALLEDYGTRLRKSKKYPSMYEEVPVRYYAALAVQKMQSQYMTEGVKERASEVIKEVNNTPLRVAQYHAAVEVETLGLVDS